MSRAGMLIASIIAVVLIGLGVVQLMPQADETEAGDETAEESTASASTTSFQAPAAGAVSVDAEPARRGELVMRIRASGVAEAQRLLNISAEVDGKIARLLVQEGDWVEAGDLLVEIDDTELRMARDRAAENYLAQIMQFSHDQIELPGVESSVAGEGSEEENALDFLRRYINAQAFDTVMRQPQLDERLAALYRADLFAANAQLTNNRVALEEAELDLERARIFAPFSGQVAGLDATQGPNDKSWPVEQQAVGQGADLMMLVDPDPIRVRVEVIESEIGLIRQGRSARVTFAAYPGEPFTGIVEAIDPVVDAERRTLSVTVRLPNADHRLKPGLSAQVSLDAQIFEDRLLVPVGAVLLRDNRQLVFRVRDGRAEWVYITIGYQNDDWVEVVSDNLQEGDLIVTSGHFTLAHDVPVNVIEPDPGDGGS